MNRLILSSILFIFFTVLHAQNVKDTTHHHNTKKESTTKIITIDEDGDRTEVIIPGVKVEVSDRNDTLTKITIGRKRFEVIDDHNRSRLRMVRLPLDRFKGHWAGFDMGFNGYVNSDFNTSLPSDALFMDLNQGKSITVSLNFLQYNIGLQRYKNNLGLVIGSGITWYNYRTDGPYYFDKDAQTNKTIGLPVPAEKDVSKNKISSTFINFPLLLEWQIPSSNDAHRFFISAGPYAGFRLCGRTKIVYHENGSRYKDHSKKDININPFQYGVMVRMGYRFIKLYGSYNFSTLYSTDMGPELYPYTIGLTLLSF